MRLKAFVFLASLLVAQAAFAPLLFKPVEGNLPPFEVQFDPKEVQIDQKVIWKKDKKSTDDSPVLAYNSSEPKTLQVELMFDGFETKEDVYAKYISRLEKMATVDKDLKRPTRVKVIWGGGLPEFEGVIESVGTKYTMFLPNGTPVRATVSVKFKEADRASFKQGADDDDDDDDD